MQTHVIGQILGLTEACRAVGASEVSCIGVREHVTLAVITGEESLLAVMTFVRATSGVGLLMN